MLFRREAFGDLWQELGRIQGEFDRVFGSRARVPSINVWSDDHNVFAEADLPGIDPAKIDVTVTEGNKLTIQAERTMPSDDNAVWVRQERPTGTFLREVTLPVLVDADKVSANYTHGVLKLTLPKSEAAKPRKITIQ